MRLDSVPVFRWNVVSWAQSVELSTTITAGTSNTSTTTSTTTTTTTAATTTTATATSNAPLPPPHYYYYHQHYYYYYYYYYSHRHHTGNITFQNCLDSGLCPLSWILNIRKHNVSETESVSVLRWGMLLCWVPWKELTCVSLPPSPEDGNIQFQKRCVFLCLEFRTMDKVQKSSDSRKLFLSLCLLN
jgi:hypothetical protein